MRAEEIRDAGELAGAVLAGGVALIENLHATIAGRSFASAGPSRRSAQVTHDTIARCAYGAVATVVRALPRLAAAAGAAAAAAPDALSLDSSLPGNAAVGALNGMWGDRLRESGSSFALRTAVRHDRADLDLSEQAVARAFVNATGRLAVFVHGLCETDDAWRPSLRKQCAKGAFDFGERLATDGGWTPVYVRYNSGLHVSDNGAALVELLDELVAAWPVPVTELALLGHSMGGLVIRSACHQGSQRNASWVEHLRLRTEATFARL